MRARTYIRVSTDEQAREGFSLSAQAARCRQFIQSQGWEEDGSYKDDGYSAKNLERPGMQQMLRDAKEKQFDVLVVYRLDRLVRSVVDLHLVINLLEEKKIAFKSVTEVFDTTTAMGRFFITLVGSMAQWERENLGERVRMGMERKFLEGKDLHTFAPYGYTTDENGKVVTDPNESAIVRRIYDMYKTKGIRTISRALNREGITTRRGNHWQDPQIQYILTNPYYIGVLRFGEHSREGNHPRLIDSDLWLETQKRIEDRRVGKRAATSDYPFSGVLTCARCGGNMIGQSLKHQTKKYIFYKCGTQHNYGTCDLPRIAETKVERSFFDALVEWQAEGINMPSDQKEGLDLKQIESELDRIKRRRRKWQEAFAADIITLEELKERTQEDRAREEELKTKLTKQPETPRVTLEEFKEAIQDLRKVWPQATATERKQIIRTLFSEIVIDRDGNGRNDPVKVISTELA
ncbi:recombinase family protein [Desmospora activa]|uniref:Site-specific DNA recombinase n=1 Tax=Desmospora activa DSM 45169 TaxID=1121389 RepID=A0A2T4Z8Y4_9BACL|nr:recombinase family protein [Desmospora activa]PTM58337.1 site-specific DNA recombinase [Desmospora activa DSM 45169]